MAPSRDGRVKAPARWGGGLAPPFPPKAGLASTGGERLCSTAGSTELIAMKKKATSPAAFPKADIGREMKGRSEEHTSEL